jgi:hypothetical protein
VIAGLAARIAGDRLAVSPAMLTRDRALGPAGAVSANGSCRMVRALDGWLAVNLPRPCDAELVPAWLGRELPDGDLWHAIADEAARSRCARLVARARLVGLAVAEVGETRGAGVTTEVRGARGTTGNSVLDLSSLWAGPLCAGLLADEGYQVTKAECVTRPDPTPRVSPAHDRALNGAKRRVAFDFADRARLHALAEAADVIVTSARMRGLASLGLDMASWFARRPGRIWVAITAHGLTGDGADRIGFGDDAAAAGGLVDWSAAGPHFVGDALADPLTGIAAARAALESADAGGGVLVDAALSCVAREAQDVRVSAAAREAA